MLNEEIPVNRYQKKDNHGSKLMETMFVIDKALKYYPFQC